MGDRSRRAALPRRGILKALALAPAALVGCAGAAAELAQGGGEPDAAGGAPAARPAGKGTAPEQALVAIRTFAVDPDGQPACVFRAAQRRRER
jgi:hypothetical protein